MVETICAFLLISNRRKKHRGIEDNLADMLAKMQRFFKKLFPDQKQRIEITIETKESWEMQRRQKRRVRYCPECGSEGVFIPADLCGKIGEIDSESLTGFMANGRLHLLAIPKEKSLVCLNSLKNELKQTGMKFK